MAFLITSPTSNAQVNAVIGPTAEMVINRSKRSIRSESRSTAADAIASSDPVQTCGGNRALGVNLAPAVFHAIADLPLVNIQADVIHRLHGGASLVFLNQRPLSSAFLHQALLLPPIHSNLPPPIPCIHGDFMVH